MKLLSARYNLAQEARVDDFSRRLEDNGIDLCSDIEDDTLQ